MAKGFKKGGKFIPTRNSKLPKRPEGKVIFVKTKKQQEELLKKERAKGMDVMKVPRQAFFEDGHKFFGVATY